MIPLPRPRSGGGRIEALLIEDDAGDALLIAEMLEGQGIEIEQAERLSAGIERLGARCFDVVLLDLALPDSNGIDSVKRITSGHAAVPVIVLTGFNDGDMGLLAIQEGAQDYLVKGRISPDVLNRSISYAVERKSIENDRRRIIEELQAALARVKVLTGLLPICASCKKIRDDEGTWHAIEQYIRDRSDARFSHGICPECHERLYPDLGH